MGYTKNKEGIRSYLRFVYMLSRRLFICLWNLIYYATLYSKAAGI